MDVQEVGGAPTVQYNSDGSAIGGIQGPWEQVPIAAYTGKAPAGAPGFCVLFGQTHPFSAAHLVSLYGSKARYVAAYTRATDDDIKAGYILPADKGRVLALADQVQF